MINKCIERKLKGDTKCIIQKTYKRSGRVLNHPDLPEIKDNYKKAVTSIILENQEKAMKEDAAFLSEVCATNSGFGGSNMGGYDPILDFSSKTSNAKLDCI